MTQRGRQRPGSLRRIMISLQKSWSVAAPGSPRGSIADQGYAHFITDS